jgi:hypothetical protein
LLSNPVPIGEYLTSATTTPGQQVLDFKIDRSFAVGSFPLKLFVYVQNVLNRKNVQHVYLHTGTATNDGAHTPQVRDVLLEYWGEDFLALYDHINHGHRQHYQIVNGGDLFGQPREIRFGVQVGLGMEK